MKNFSRKKFKEKKIKSTKVWPTAVYVHVQLPPLVKQNWGERRLSDCSFVYFFREEGGKWSIFTCSN